MKMRTFFVGGAAAAVATYLFDPQQGAGRRARLRDQLMARLRDLRDDSRRRRTHARNVAQGAVSTMQERATEIREHAVSSIAVVEDVTEPDTVIRDRVHSEVFGKPDVPKDRVVVNVEDAIVVLRGELDSEEQIRDLLRLVGAVRGVRAIDSWLHVRGTPAPNKAEAVEASGHAEQTTPATGSAIQ